MKFVSALVYKINVNLIRLKSKRNKNVNLIMFIDLCFNFIRSNWKKNTNDSLIMLIDLYFYVLILLNQIKKEQKCQC